MFASRIPCRLREETGVDIPMFHPCILELSEDGFPKNTLRFKAYQVHNFTR